MVQIKQDKLSLLTFFAIAIFSWCNIHAESIVYIIGRDFGGGKPSLELSIDGKNVGSIMGSVIKTINPSWGTNQKIPFVGRKATIKKCLFHTEGKVLIRIDASTTNISNPSSTAKYYGEVQLDLEDGKTYYLQIKPKGLTNIQLVEIPEKKAIKELSKEKKYEILPDWIQTEE